VWRAQEERRLGEIEWLPALPSGTLRTTSSKTSLALR
jgi:hypothetical protein